MNLPNSVRLSVVRAENDRLIVNISLALWAEAVLAGFCDLLRNLVVEGTLAPDQAVDLAQGLAEMIVGGP